LQRGDNIALVSDAGTPGISDPGFNLVKAAIEEEIAVEMIPGPSAIVCALVLSGLPTDRFSFEGFLPPKADRRMRKLLSLKDEERTLVFYESPHRVKDSLADMATVLGDRESALIREMTKLHEEVLRCGLFELRDSIAKREKVHGEITIVVAGARFKDSIEENIDLILDEEIASFEGSPSELARKLSQETGLSRQVIYSKILDRKNKT
jgi:16S rRNA (cytidine1402-2'-O)-methyltransferase